MMRCLLAINRFDTSMDRIVSLRLRQKFPARYARLVAGVISLLVVLALGIFLVRSRNEESCQPADPCTPLISHTISDFQKLPNDAAMAFAPGSKLLSLFGGEMKTEEQRRWNGEISMLRLDVDAGEEKARHSIAMKHPAFRMRVSPDNARAALFCYPGSNREDAAKFGSRPCLEAGGEGLIVSTADARQISTIAAADPRSLRAGDFPGGPTLPAWASWMARFLPAGGLIVDRDTASADIVVWSVADQRPVKRLTPDTFFPDGRLIQILPSPSGRLIAAVYFDFPANAKVPTLIRVWDVESGMQVASFAARYGVAEEAIWTPNETRIVTVVNVQQREGQTQVVLDIFEVPR